MDFAGKRFAVIGGAGFIGSHIVESLLAYPVAEIVIVDNLVRGRIENVRKCLEQDNRVRFVEGTICDPEFVRTTLDGVDGVFHLAAMWLGECLHQPRSALDVNIIGTFNVAQACLDGGVSKLVFSSSASVYGDALVSPMPEDHPFNNRTFYGATKIAGEQILRALHDQHGLDYVGLRYMNVYGPRMDYKGTYVSVIMKVLDRLEKGLPPVIYGDGSQSYDFVHVSDVARANLLAMQSAVTDDFLNVGTGCPTTIAELVQTLIDITGADIAPEYFPEGQSFVTRRLGCTKKAHALLGFQANIGLQEGLRSVVAWRSQQPLATGLQH